MIAARDIIQLVSEIAITASQVRRKMDAEFDETDVDENGGVG